ncbi:ATP-dependent DNA helicase PcrA [Wickerhamiella sorbophila]|uniref:DNA 3'-5' helicase n=1 Tax=Wickerhamiella sorbophila TaxID=45607 RepID=A0A2T0FDE3_9ASCO|nr:ATP-dependent DNA helicase PcrA [Wickerhamiella sorbophila]PRT52987.1 ATP-dependent DNA helicase PcrA [Wickerhamiella sorbophila]
MNAEQKLAVSAPKGYVQIIAGPGTGKTFTLIHRLKYLIDSGLDPKSLVVMTFTNQAANEMTQRLSIDKSQMPFLSTFHKVAIRILKQIGRVNFRIAVESDQRSILSDIVQGADLDFLYTKSSGEKISFQRTQSKDIDILQRCISKLKGQGIGPNDSDRLFPFYCRYNAELERRGMYDFDDILIKLRDYLWDPSTEEGKRIQQFAKTIQGVLVDEFQDTNALQLDLAEALAEESGCLTVVGDPDQSIYGFRTANPKNFSTLTEHHPETHIYFLSRNYRSTNGILSFAESTINKSHTRLFSQSRELKAVAKCSSTPYMVQSAEFQLTAQFHALANQIERLVNSGIEYGEVAVLARQRRHFAVLEAILLRQKIPYKVFGGKSLSKRKSIQLILDYLRVVVSGEDDMALSRTINVPARGIGPKTLEVLKGNHRNLYLAMLEKSPHKGVHEYLNLICNLREMREQNGDLYDIVSLVMEVVQAEVRDDENYVSAFIESCRGIPANELEECMENWALDTSQSTDRGSVTLSTIHSAKGLEWPVVYVTLNNDFFNFMDNNQHDEETRLLYVAMTRACAHLVVLYNTPHPGLPDNFKAVKSIDQCAPDMKALSSILKRKIVFKRPTVDDQMVGFISAIDLPIPETKPETAAKSTQSQLPFRKLPATKKPRHEPGRPANQSNQSTLSSFFKISK